MQRVEDRLPRYMRQETPTREMTTVTTTTMGRIQKEAQVGERKEKDKNPMLRKTMRTL